MGTAAGPRTVIARADSFTGPPRVAMPFNLENDDAESVESVRARDASLGGACDGQLHWGFVCHDPLAAAAGHGPVWDTANTAEKQGLACAAALQH